MELKILEAIPEVFSRQYTTLVPNTHALVALSLLRFQNVDAIPIGAAVSGGRKIAVSGYSSLSEVFASSRSNFAEFLEKPCKNISVKLATIKAEDDLKKLLRTITRTHFGFACIEENIGQEMCGLVSLRDLLPLYGKSIFRSKLSIREVASSPVFALELDASLKIALSEMLRHGIRRVFVTGTNKVVSDRSIINHIFSVSKLHKASSESYDLLEAKISEIDGSSPNNISSDANVGVGAETIIQTTDDCLVCEKGVVTPWDIVIKPWKLGKLVVT